MTAPTRGMGTARTVTLRADRYHKDCRPFILDLIRQVRDYDYDTALAFYAEAVPLMREAEIATLGCNDRYFLFTQLLNRKDGLHPWLYARCREVEANPDGYLDLWARYHYKSSLITFAGSIQEILCDPTVTIAIFSATNQVARPFLAQIKTELEKNERLINLYPDVLWQSDGERRAAKVSWSVEGGICVKRPGNPKEQTVEAFGLVEGSPTGRHFKVLIYDDLITERLVTSEEMVKKVTERWELSDNLGIGEGTRKWHVGTRYSFADTYGHLLKTGILKERIYPATDTGRMDGTPVYLTPEHWEQVKRTQRSTVAAQMLQNPLAGQENTFEPQWLRPYTLRPRTLNVYIMADPSMGRSAGSDNTAIAVVGIDAQGNKYLLDGYRHRMRLSERWEALKRLHKKWSAATGVQHVHVGYERYGMQADLEYFEERMRQEDYAFGIAELNWVKEGKQSKEDRVQRLEPDFRGNKFYLPAKVWVAPSNDASPAICAWSVDDDSGKIVYNRLTGETREERTAKADGESYRLVEPIKRLDADRNVYDLTEAFFFEYLFFPFAPRDDLIDAVSRIYDMEPDRPMSVRAEYFELPQYPD